MHPEAIVKLFSNEKKMTLFLHKNTHHTIPCEKSYFFLVYIFRSPVPLLFLFHFRGRKCIIALMASCLHKKFQTK